MDRMKSNKSNQDSNEKKKPFIQLDSTPLSNPNSELKITGVFILNCTISDRIGSAYQLSGIFLYGQYQPHQLYLNILYIIVLFGSERRSNSTGWTQDKKQGRNS